MGILLIIFFVLLLSFSLVYLRYPRQVSIAIQQFPRDIFALYKYGQTWLFSLICKARNETTSKYFDKVANSRPNQTCFLFEEEVWTYSRVQESSLRVAKYFKRAGYKKGDVVGLFMESRPDYVCTWLGLGRLGVITSLINHNLRASSLAHCINVSNCKGLIFGEELTAAIQDLADSGGNKAHLQLYSVQDRVQNETKLTCSHIDLSRELETIDKVGLKEEDFGAVNNSDVAFYIFTSGTTGLPKAAKLKYSRIFTFGAVAYPLCMNPGKDILLTPIPLYHIQGGVLGVTCALFHGVPQVILRKFSASSFWKTCIKYDVTYCQFLGEIVRYLYNQPPSKLDKLHKVSVFYGNGASPAIWPKFTERFNVRIVEMYGSTEGNCSIMNLEGHPSAVGYLPTWLYPILPVFLARVDPTTGHLARYPDSGLLQHVGLDEGGELLGKIVSSNPFREFEGYTDPNATEGKIVRNVKKHGDQWFRTGDTLTRDECGYFYFRDRTGDSFRWKGENVATLEVEQVLAKSISYLGKELPAIACYGVTVPNMEGRCGMATISVAEGDLDLKKLSKAVVHHLPFYARPVFLRVTRKELNMTGTFKLLKTELQREGYDPSLVSDPLYILVKEEYVPLVGEIWEGVVNGRVRL